MKWLWQNKLVIFLAFVKFILPLVVINPVWELHRDEYLYYQQGQHLALGFLESPPLLSLLAYLSSLAGGSVFTIKFWPALFGALTLLVTTAMVKELGGKLFAQVIAASGILFSAYMRVHYLFQPNFLDIFFWTLSAYFLICYINTQQNKFLYCLSIALALGWWSKYSVLFFIAAIILSLLLTRHREIFKKKAFWMAVSLGLLLIIPNILWQYFHKFPVIVHMKELRETQLQYINKTDFIKEQILMLLPVVFVWIAGLMWLLKNSTYRIIAFMYLVVLILLLAGSGKNYYSLGAYPMVLAAGSVWLEKISINRRWIKYASVPVIVVLSVLLVPVLLPLQTPKKMVAFNQKYKLREVGLLKWEDLRDHDLQQDFADMLGWKELSAKSEKFYHSLSPAEQSDCMIYCRNYGQAGALKYYGIDEAFKSKVSCDNGTFLLWISPRLYFKHLIFIGRQMPDKDDEVFNHFREVTIIDSVSDPLSRQFGDKIIFYHDADSIALKLARDGLNEMKQQFMLSPPVSR
ncbi:MAG: glycosyltransferase family 39 protein [Ginsengibacter sp.]